MTPPHLLDLMRNLIQSDADNATEDILRRVVTLGIACNWTPEQMQKVAELACDVRLTAIMSTMDTVIAVLQAE